MEDLGDSTVFNVGTEVPEYWFEAMVPTYTPSGRRIPRGPAARTFHEVLALIAAGQAVSPPNGHVGRYYTPPGITFLPIHDAPLTAHGFVPLCRQHVTSVSAAPYVQSRTSGDGPAGD